MVVSAVFAGFVTGLIVALLQIIMLEPIILEAELYETGQLIHFGDITANMPDIEIERDWIRSGYSVLSAASIYIGFALLMVAAFAVAETKGVEIT
ncbi:MAG: CbtA family protein, partial [Paracoccaceae bacterium]